MEEKAFDIAVLIKRKMDKTSSPEEDRLLEEWASASEHNRRLLLRLTDPDQLQGLIRKYYQEAQVLTFLTNSKSPVKIRKLYWYAAASILLLISLGSYLFFKPSTPHSTTKLTSVQVTEFLPATQKATLTMDDKVVILADVRNGKISSDQEINKTGDGEIVYVQDHLGEREKVEMHVLATPKGGYYKVILPDQSTVWLNAASTLRYPSRFTGESRIVELAGEAYFEVAKMESPVTHQKMPFFVKTGEVTIEVLGTKFNITNYPEEQNIKTSLLEGSVKVSAIGVTKSSVIAPGQQAVLQHNIWQIKQAEVDNIISWTRQQFFFDNLPLTEVVRQLQRWYGIDEVHYENGMATEKEFYGKMQRNLPLSVVLPQIEQMAGIHLEIKNNSLYLSKIKP